MENQHYKSPPITSPVRAPSDVSNPLRGIKICCTAIPPEKRSELASQVEQMGAQHKFDLTSDVTHLIVGAYETPKYRYVAKERPDVKVLKPSWIEAVRQLWIEDQPIDLDAIEQEHSLPTFAGLQVCMTGFEDQEYRQSIVDLVAANGADYHGDLTKKVTHLVAYKPEGAKYKHAKLWGIRLVSVEWLYDSIERGMILDENLYNPEWPEEERGKGAWIRRKLSPVGKRTRDDSFTNMEEGRRKLRRTASTKLTSQNEKIWGDIVGAGSTVHVATSRVWGETTEEETKLPEPAEGAQQVSSDSGHQPHVQMAIGSKGIFHGCHFCIHGFDKRKTEVLRKHLSSHEGVITNTVEDLANMRSSGLYIVVPNTLLSSEVPAVSNSPSAIHAITDWWVEQCMATKTLIPPGDYLLGCPFPKFPLDRFEGITVCSTGFDGMQLRHISLGTALMGAKYDEVFSKDATVLICNPIRNLRKEKLLSAQTWDIPVVSLDWLLASIQLGERQPFKPYLYRLKRSVNGSELPSGRAKESSPEHNDDIGQSKAEVAQRNKKEALRPAKTSRLDTTAFHDDAPVNIKLEEPCIFAPSTISTEPLAEISSNSPRRPMVSLSKESSSASDTVITAIPQETITTAISTLLAKSKTTNDNPEYTDTAEGVRKKRAPSKILGRAASNVSAVSCTSSVDSTASTGQAVAWPANKRGSVCASSEQRSSISLRGTAQSERERSSNAILDDLVANADGEQEEEAEPPQTQMQYVDSESSEYKARVLARVKGTKYERKERARVATIASLSSTGDGARRKGRALRERQSGGLR